jgi:hypothetical protein
MIAALLLSAALAANRPCNQFDCASSGLYWHTDLDAARAEAKDRGKPILSLRLLGRLDEEMSCANSRFFRILLYADPGISRYMRENFVLHWSSERPVPVVTIDFGDGRIMRRTLTGNSVHYLLDEKGTPIDALPGLYAPKAFLTELQKLGRHRRENIATVVEKLRRPHAWIAAPIAASKGIVEVPILLRVSFGVTASVTPRALPKSDDEWTQLDAGAVARIQAKHGAGDIAMLLENLRRTLRVDTLRNENELRPLIRQRIAAGATLEELNRYVYDELFATPRSDPWLGLMPEEAFTGLPNEGIANE